MMRRNNYTWERKILLNGLLFFKHYIFKQACSFKVNFLPCINRFITLFCISWLFVYCQQLFSIIFRHRSPGKNNMHFSADNSIRVFSLNILPVDSIPTVFSLLARFFIAHKKTCSVRQQISHWLPVTLLWILGIETLGKQIK